LDRDASEAAAAAAEEEEEVARLDFGGFAVAGGFVEPVGAEAALAAAEVEDGETNAAGDDGVRRAADADGTAGPSLGMAVGGAALRVGVLAAGGGIVAVIVGCGGGGAGVEDEDEDEDEEEDEEENEDEDEDEDEEEEETVGAAVSTAVEGMVATLRWDFFGVRSRFSSFSMS
jgi:hypothetical protein